MKKLICLMAFLFAVPCFAHFTYVNVNDGKHLLTKGPGRVAIIASITSDDDQNVPNIVATSYNPQTGKVDTWVSWKIFLNGDYSYWYASGQNPLYPDRFIPKGIKVTKIEVMASLLYETHDANVEFRS